MSNYIFIDSRGNLIETVKASSYGQAMRKLSEIAKTLLIDFKCIKRSI